MWLRYAIPLQKIHPLAEVVPPKSYEAENSPRRSEIKWCPTSLHLHLVCVCVGGGCTLWVLSLIFDICFVFFNSTMIYAFEMIMNEGYVESNLFIDYIFLGSSTITFYVGGPIYAMDWCPLPSMYIYFIWETILSV